MKLYLLSVVEPAGPLPPPEFLQSVMRDVEVFREALDLDGYYLFHAIRADLLRRLGRDVEAARAYEAALARTDNAAERDLLRRRRAALDSLS